jgi:futalosine hydrolase
LGDAETRTIHGQCERECYEIIKCQKSHSRQWLPFIYNFELPVAAGNFYMTCLLASATAIEIAPFTGYYRDMQNELPRNLQIDVLVTGVGMLASAYSLLKQVQVKRPDIIIQAGIGGCFDASIPLGTVVAIKQETIGDLGVIESGKMKTLFDLGLVKKNQFPFSNGWLVNNSAFLKKTTLKKVKAITTNEISTSQQKIKLYRDNFDAVIESQEGAALHYTCLMEKIPFIQIRSVSNYTGERNKKKWTMEESIRNLNKELRCLLDLLA